MFPPDDDEKQKNRRQTAGSKGDKLLDGEALWKAYSEDIKPLEKDRQTNRAVQKGSPVRNNHLVQHDDAPDAKAAKATSASKRVDLNTVSAFEFGLSAIVTPDSVRDSGLVSGGYATGEATGRVVSSSQQIDKNTAERLRKGQIPIDDKIDLHGLYQEQARERLRGFIQSAYHRRLRCVLVVTGKGLIPLDHHDGRGFLQIGRDHHSQTQTPGVIKRNFKSWLAVEPYASMILKIQKSHIKHGGEGAYYILLRRQK